MFKWLVRRRLEKIGIRINGGRPQDIRVNGNGFYKAIALSPILGSVVVAESYMRGEFECTDLLSFIEHVLRSGKRYVRKPSLLEWWIALKVRLGNPQNMKGSRKVGKQHYDIGYDLYEPMLGETMAYSCGYWPGAKTLSEAQRHKYRLVCDKLGLKSGERVLEIGCGWGGFAKFAAEQYGVKVVGLTISTKQAAYATELCKGLEVEIHDMDYRLAPHKFGAGQFDKVVSIGMFEHVGLRNYSSYFAAASDCLRPGGLMLLHTIVNLGFSTDTFTYRHIFPGGFLPNEMQIAKFAKPHFVLEDMHNFGYDYYWTLDCWWNNFRSAWPKLRESGAYDERFYRMWEWYLRCCAAGFKVRALQLQQYVLAKGGVAGGYQSVRPTYVTPTSISQMTQLHG